jgi:hypothetical protein
MNIFVSHRCPFESAQALDDQRVNKMITESLQMLVTAARKNGAPEEDLPQSKAGVAMKSTHAGHPCTLWIGQNRANYHWLTLHLTALCSEFEYRYGHKHHGASQLGRVTSCSQFIPHKGQLDPHPNCTDFKQITDIETAYRTALCHKWQNQSRPPRWTRRGKPEWALLNDGVDPVNSLSDPGIDPVLVGSGAAIPPTDNPNLDHVA